MSRTVTLVLAAGLVPGLIPAQPQPDRPPTPPPSNERVGIDVDRFIGNPFQSPVRSTHEVMLKRAILRHGDPHQAGDPGAVLQYRKEFSVVTLMGGNRTPLVELPDQQVFYVHRGQGRLDTGAEYWDLRRGIAVLIPPKAKHRFTNLAGEPLEMLMLAWENPAGVTPRSGILVRDVNELPFAEQNAHWSYMAKNLFHPKDGLHPNEKFLVVYLPPMSIGSPHSHPPQWEEVWTTLPPGEGSYLQLGSEIREWPGYTGYLVPPNGRTVHSSMNLTRDRIVEYFYFGRYTSPTPNPPDDPSVAPKPLP
jgi:quercetin dioxygenase-like cupin family protein